MLCLKNKNYVQFRLKLNTKVSIQVKRIKSALNIPLVYTPHLTTLHLQANLN